MNIYVVSEIEGGSLLEAFTCEQDAKSFLQWEEAMGKIHPSTYTVKTVRLRD